MSTYGTMQTRIANELSRTDLTSRIQESILTAIKHYERERWYWNEATTTTTTVAGTSTYALPADFMRMDSVLVTQNSWKNALEPMSYIEMDELDSGSSSTRSVPRYWAIYGNVLRLYPIPDAVYTITESYQKRLTALSGSSDTNAWVDDAEELIRTRAKVIICQQVLRDFQLAQYLSALEANIYQRLRTENDERLLSGKTRAYYI